MSAFDDVCVELKSVQSILETALAKPKAFWEQVTPNDVDYKAIFPEARKLAKTEARERKKAGRKWGSGREKVEFVNRRAMAIAFEMTLAARRSGIAEKDNADRAVMMA